MTLKEFNDFGRALNFTFDNAPVLGAPEPDDNYVTLTWNIHHKIPGADWTHIAAISCLTISNPLHSLHDGTRFDLYPEPNSLVVEMWFEGKTDEAKEILAKIQRTTDRYRLKKD